MTTLKQGDLIKDNTGDTYKILEVWGNILFISCTYNHKSYGFTANEEWLKERGYIWDTPAWESEYEGDYWHPDKYRRDFLGIHQTDALAEAALLEIRRKLGK